MSQTDTKQNNCSILLARRFEKWILGLFCVAMLLISILQLFQRDYWAAVIFFLASVLTGVIGQGLSQNIGRSTTELGHGHATIPKGAAQIAMTEIELKNFSKCVLRFGLLLSATLLALGIHVSAPSGRITVMIITAWILLFGCTYLLGLVSKIK